MSRNNPMGSNQHGNRTAMQYGGKSRRKNARTGPKQLKRRHPEPPYDAWRKGELRDEDLKLKAMQAHVPDEVWMNSRYQVLIYRNILSSEGWPPMHWLSIKRRDKNIIRDWRDLQQIKNDLIGEGHEAVELFPSESRLVDTSNQYHLYVLADQNQTFPFGFGTRLVSEDESEVAPGRKPRQRPFPLDRKPADLKTTGEVGGLMREATDAAEVRASSSLEKLVVAEKGLANYSDDAVSYAIAMHLFRVLQMQNVSTEDMEPLRRWSVYLVSGMSEAGDPLPNASECEQIYHAANSLRCRLMYAANGDDDMLEQVAGYWPPAPEDLEAAIGAEAVKDAAKGEQETK